MASLKCNPAAVFCAKPPGYQGNFVWLGVGVQGKQTVKIPGTATPGILHIVGSPFEHRNSPELFPEIISTLSPLGFYMSTCGEKRSENVEDRSRFEDEGKTTLFLHPH